MLSKAKNFTEGEFKALLLNLADQYENYGSSTESGESTSGPKVPNVSDAEFDLLVKLYENKFDKKFSEVGSLHKGKGDDVELPYPMQSLNKAKGEDAEKSLASFQAKNEGPYVIADKLDGNSAEYIVKHRKGKVIRHLYTRGNGTIGKDISKAIPYLGLPIPDEDIVIRGEIVFPKLAFEKYVKKQKKLGVKRKLNNSRNVANGIILAQESFSKKACSQLQFVPFNILSDHDLNQDEQYDKLEQAGFITPWRIITEDLTVKHLTKLLKRRRDRTPWDIDGLVISNNEYQDFPADTNPTHQIAFKIDTLVETTVTKVIYKASKDGKLKPVVHFEKVFVAGNDVVKCYAHNAKFIVDEKIGPGAVIVITRGGDVIPALIAVLKPAEKAKLPTYAKDDYEWNETEVDFVLTNPDRNPDVRQSRIKYFVNALKIENLGPGRIAALYDVGIKSIKALIEASVNKMASGEKLGPKSAKTIHRNIHSKITDAPLATVMTASGVFGFGFGETRPKQIVEAYPDIMDYVDAKEGKVTKMLVKLGGFNKMASTFEENLPKFEKWLKRHPLITIAVHKPKKLVSKRDAKKLPLYNQIIVFTGIRDAGLNEQIEVLGGEVVPSFRVTATIVVAKDTSKVTNKVKQAEARGIKLYSFQAFVKKYNLTTSKL